MLGKLPPTPQPCQRQKAQQQQRSQQVNQPIGEALGLGLAQALAQVLEPDLIFGRDGFQGADVRIHRLHPRAVAQDVLG